MSCCFFIVIAYIADYHRKITLNAAAQLIAGITQRESISNTLRSLLLSCHISMSIQVNGASLQNFTLYYTSLHNFVKCSIGIIQLDY